MSRKNELLDLPGRIRRLITGNYTWVSAEGEESGTEHYKWSYRWAIDGVHSWRWWWVQKYGTQNCGCVINPLTRRIVLSLLSCAKHTGELRHFEKEE